MTPSLVLGTEWFYLRVWFKGWNGSVFVFGWRDGDTRVPCSTNTINRGPACQSNKSLILSLRLMSPTCSPTHQWNFI